MGEETPLEKVMMVDDKYHDFHVDEDDCDGRNQVFKNMDKHNWTWIIVLIVTKIIGQG